MVRLSDPESPRTHRLEAGALLLATLVVAGSMLWFAGNAAREAPSWLLPLDDSYVFLRYAQQAARGEPLQWTSGEASTGASSFLYPWVEAPAFWISGSLAFASRWAFWAGVPGLWLLALGGSRLLRVARAPDPWPLAGGLSLTAFGPIVFTSVGGMESAWNGAAILWVATLWAESRRAHGPRARVAGRNAVFLAAFLPWLRPENGVLTLGVALCLFLGVGPRVGRWWAPVILAPGAFLAGLDWTLTGHLSPAGALAKSRLGTPFLDLGLFASLYLGSFVDRIVPVYIGRPTFVLPPPIGWLAVAGIGRTLWVSLVGRRPRGPVRWPRLLPAAALWLALLLLAPLSSLVHWHYWRHHQGALALAWIFALALLADLVERWRGPRSVRLRFLAFLAPLILFLLLPSWGVRYAQGMDVLWRRNGGAAEWLAEHSRGRVLLVNDAGLLALYHDGPMIDAVGLGTSGLALPFRHGPGSLLEALARQETPPEIAAVHPEMFRIPELLGERLREPDRPGGIEIARVRREPLAGTRLSDAGIDFGLLADEEGLEWDPPPHPNHASFALLRPREPDQMLLGGCRPVLGTLTVPLPEAGIGSALRVTALNEEPVTLEIGLVDESGSLLRQGTLSLTPDLWQEGTIPATTGAAALVLGRQGQGIPCVETLEWGE